jgi:hypothetical protein
MSLYFLHCIPALKTTLLGSTTHLQIELQFIYFDQTLP